MFTVGGKVKLRILVVLFLLLFSINIAAAELAYYIDTDVTNGNVYINSSIGENSETAYIIEKTAGYSPNGSAIFPIFLDGSDLNDFIVGSSITLSTDYTKNQDDECIKLESTSSSSVAYVNIPENSNLIIEYDIYDESLPSRGKFAVTDGAYITNGFIWAIGHDINPNAWSYYDGTWVSNVGSATASTWYHVTLDIAPAGYDVYIDNSLLQSELGYAGTPTAFDRINLGLSMPSGSATTYYDNIYVRKTTTNNPSVVVTDFGSYYVVNVSTTDAIENYQIPIPCSDLSISSYADSLLIQEVQNPSVIVNLTNPANNSYINLNTLSYNITGIGDLNASVFVDNVFVWSGLVSAGNNQINVTLSQGLHSWYVNGSATYLGNTTNYLSETWYFTYDTILPATQSIDVDPDYQNIANGTIVQTNIEWSDANLDYAQFYIDTGSGYTLDDSITFSSTTQWFNTSINTTGLSGSAISWYQIAYDEAGNSYTYSDSFNVVESELNIYVYDETTGEQILPSSVTVYNDGLSKDATISEVTKVASLDYTDLTTDKYIVRVAADGYYSRHGMIDIDITSLTELNIYMPSENETVIYDTFKIIDNTMQYDYDNLVIRLDKPMSEGTETIYSSYFDFAGSAAAYLIATDQYILYIITPTQTITYGWMTPDADGQIDISLNGITIYPYYDNWHSYNYSVSNGIVSLDYSSTESISYANFVIENSSSELYNVTSFTDTGSFNYVIGTNETLNVYFELVREDGATFSDFWIVKGTDAEQNVFPDSYPQWLKNSVVTALAILCILGFSSYRVEVGMALGVGIVGLAYIWGEYQINDSTGYTVALLAFITIIVFVIQQRKEASR